MLELCTFTPSEGSTVAAKPKHVSRDSSSLAASAFIITFIIMHYRVYTLVSKNLHSVRFQVFSVYGTVN